MHIIPPGICRICTDDKVTAPTFSDTISPAPSCATAAGGYTVSRTWTITDQCKRTTSAVQKLYVRDTTAPAFCYVPNDRAISCPAEIQGYGAIPTATDNCDSS